MQAISTKIRTASKIVDDPLREMIEETKSKLNSMPKNFDYSARCNNEYSRLILESYPGSHVHTRSAEPFFLQSAPYGRSQANSFVRLNDEDNFLVGQIMMFFETEETKYCLLQSYEILEKVELDLNNTPFSDYQTCFEPIGYIVEPSSQFLFKRLNTISDKLIYFEFGDLIYRLTQMVHFEHD